MNAAEAEALLVESESGRVPDVSRRRRRGVRVTTGAAMALGLALGGGAVAGAASSPAYSSSGPPAHAGMPTGATPSAQGTVKSVGTYTFTLTTRSYTTVTVNVTSTTSYRDAGVTSASLANVTVGETVTVFGTDSSNVVTATSVAIGAAGIGGMGGTPPASTSTSSS